MKVIERFTLSKRGEQEKNEDALYVGERIIAVVDGVTSKTATPHGADVSGGCFAAETIIRALENIPAITDAGEILDYLNANLINAVSASVFSTEKEPPAASVILYDSWTHRVISYGDCQLLLRGITHKREKRLDKICAQKRADILLALLRSGKTCVEELLTCDVGRKAIEADILDSFLRYANMHEEYGFPVLGTGEIVHQYIDVFQVLSGEEVVLASDGYPVLRPTLLESEKELQRIIVEDPLLIQQYKSTKGVVKGNVSYDDRSYLRFIAQ